jgi:hypothetical protein
VSDPVAHGGDDTHQDDAYGLHVGRASAAERARRNSPPNWVIMIREPTTFEVNQ